MAEISDSEFILLDTKVYKSESFNRESTLDTQTQIIKRRRPSNTWIFILGCREVLSVWLSSEILYGRAYANSLFLFSPNTKAFFCSFRVLKIDLMSHAYNNNALLWTKLLLIISAPFVRIERNELFQVGICFSLQRERVNSEWQIL